MEALITQQSSQAATAIPATTAILVPPNHFSPATIMARPDTVARLATQFFVQNKETPTPAGLALQLGFSSTVEMLNAALAPSVTGHPPESAHILMQALTRIEDSLSQAALNDDVNVPFVKFMFSSRLGIVPKKEVISDANSNKININILGVSPDEAPTINISSPSQGQEQSLEDLL